MPQTRKLDYNSLLVIGSGMAGLLVALLAADRTPVTLLTKEKASQSSTDLAQGGIAAVWDEKDSIDLHIADTLNAGNGLCDKEAVSILSQKSHESILSLIDFGVTFDKDKNGKYQLGLEGAHSLPRILHAGGDATGREIRKVLFNRVMEHPNIKLLEDSQVTEICSLGGEITGVQVRTSGKSVERLEADCIILATGGAGQLYKYTSNPSVATGDGVTLAYRAGADLMDLEFFQFHPTALSLPGKPNYLITEAMRGEGAVLRNSAGEAFMENRHPLKDLAPRDIVARSIAHELSKTPESKVYLDISTISSERIEKRFPTVFESCLKCGLDIRNGPIPVTPVSHFMIGGVATDLWGRTTLKGLYACGEVARTGIHGSNRLASNSLLECVVFATRINDALQLDCEQLPKGWKIEPSHTSVAESYIESPLGELSLSAGCSKSVLQKLVWDRVGLIRNRNSLEELLRTLGRIPDSPPEGHDREEFSLHSLKLLAKLMGESALYREESRGSHFRDDFPLQSKKFNHPVVRNISETLNKQPKNRNYGTLSS